MEWFVRCSYCGWEGVSSELDAVQTDAMDEDGNYLDYPCCPDCGSIEGVMEIE